MKDAFIKILGEKNVLSDEAMHAPYLQELRGLYVTKTPLVLRPETTQQVSEVLAYANTHNIKIVPQGGATGLVGGHIPSQNGEVILSLSKMNNLREADPAGQYLIVDAGMTLGNLRAEAMRRNRLFPLSLPSEGSCTIGGNMSTNAGGTAVLAYGNTRDLILGLEVVLADGRILNMLRTLKKDNTGYDLRHLFMGAEGTLGVITGVVVKLFPKINAIETAFIGLKTPQDALKLFTMAQEKAGGSLTTFELMIRFGLDVVLKHGSNVRDPLAQIYPWYVLLELSSPSKTSLRPLLEELLGEAFEAGIIEDATIAESETQQNDFWRIRHQMSETQSREGGSIKHDISVAVDKVPAFINECLALLKRDYPNARPLPFGHMGDGNLHFNLSQGVGEDKQAFLDKWEEVNEKVHTLTTAYGGSISAEHGIGMLKRDKLKKVKDPATYAVMQSIKMLLDPKNTLNPNKVL